MTIMIFELRNKKGKIIDKYKLKNFEKEKIKIGSDSKNDIVINYYSITDFMLEFYFTNSRKLSVKLLNSVYPILKNSQKIIKNQFLLYDCGDNIFFWDYNFYLHYKFHSENN